MAKQMWLQPAHPNPTKTKTLPTRLPLNWEWIFAGTIGEVW